MNKIAFTICSRSYIGMANVLRNSFLRYNDGYEFFIILADTDYFSGNIICGKQISVFSRGKYILASGIMGAAIILLRIATADIPAAWRCVLCIIAGTAVYGIVLAALKEKSISSKLRAKRNTDK